MSAAWIVALTGLAWAVHLLDWLLAVHRRRGRVAHEGEWMREIIVRLVMAALVILSLARPGRVPDLLIASIALALIWGGTTLAIVGRRRLAGAWGIGVRPHGAVVATGIHALVRHPIYVGTGAVLVGQSLALANVPSLLLLGGALVIVPLKIAREGALLKRSGIIGPGRIGND